jgi:hypothetical protein
MVISLMDIDKVRLEKSYNLNTHFRVFLVITINLS